MPYDALASPLATKTTATTANVSGAGFNTKTGTPTRGMKVRCITYSYSAPTLGAVFTHTIDISSDSTTWIAGAFSGIPLTAATATASDIQYIEVFLTKKYPWLRHTFKVSPTTGTPNAVYQADLGIALR